jgi:hypothetical protein
LYGYLYAATIGCGVWKLNLDPTISEEGGSLPEEPKTPDAPTDPGNPDNDYPFFSIKSSISGASVGNIKVGNTE